MNVFIGLLSLAGLSLFLARRFCLSASLTPLLSVAAAVLWFTVFGCAGFLYAGGLLWYALCAAALCFVVWKEKTHIVRLFTPGFVFFVVAGCFFIILFLVTQPLFTRWDEFIFWGAAGKALKETNVIYTAADANLLARAQAPGMPLFSYMMMFLGRFAEYKMMAAYDVFMVAAFAAPAALWDTAPLPAGPAADAGGGRQLAESRAGGRHAPAAAGAAGAVLLVCAMLALPVFLEADTGSGAISWAYRTVYGDFPMAAMFGGALCYYFAGSAKKPALLIGYFAILAALVSLKDMGLALALLAAAIVSVDLLFCEKDAVFAKFMGKKVAFIVLGRSAAAIAAAYALWLVHLKLSPYGADRLDLGSGGEHLGQVEMLLTGFKAMFGLVQHGQYQTIAPMMRAAFFTLPVSVVGSGAVVLALVALVLLAAWLCAPVRAAKLRVAVFAAASAVGFAAFYTFNVFTYALIFKPIEALILKDYDRYMMPYWMAWLMASLTLLGMSAAQRAGGRRVLVARAAAACAALALVAAAVFGTNPEVNFLHMTDTLFTTRWDVRGVIAEAARDGMQKDDVVYLVSQWDDGDRYGKFAIDMDAHLALQYERAATDASGETVLVGNTGTSLVEPGKAAPYARPAEATPEDFTAFLKQEGVTHVLLDEPDDYFLEAFAPLFSDRLAGWSTDASLSRGARYYRVEWDGGTCTLVRKRGAA